MLIRLTNKDLNSSFVNNSITPLHKNQLLAAFSKISDNPDFPDRVSINGIKEVGMLFGQNFKMDEWLIIVKESMENDIEGEFISLQRFIDYIQKVNEEIKIDPYNLIRDLLINADGGNLVSLDGDISLEKFR